MSPLTPARVAVVSLLALGCPAQDALEADAEVLVRACNEFGATLHGELARTAQPTCSPASVAIALLMLLPGARGATADEIRAVLRLPDGLHGERLDAAAKELLGQLRGIGDDKLGQRATDFRLVDDLWVQRSFPIEARYADTLRSVFGAEATNVDFAGAPEAARGQINAHVAKVTNDRIRELIPAGLVVPDTRVVLTNAMWLRGSWLHPFPDRLTKDAAFHLATGTEVQVPTMQHTERFGYAETDDWQALSLQFADGRVACDVLLPAAGKALADVEQVLLRGGHAGPLVQQQVYVRLPKFTVSAAHRLKGPLQSLGMRTVFTPMADLSGVTRADRLLVDEVVHQTWITIDEQGAEAAAATAVLMKRGGRPAQPKEFRADRPFAFALRDLRTGLLLFVGRVEDPRRAAN